MWKSAMGQGMINIGIINYRKRGKATPQLPKVHASSIAKELQETTNLNSKGTCRGA